MKKNLYELPVVLPARGCTLVYTNNGEVTAAVIKRPDQYVATIEELIELVRLKYLSLNPPEKE